SETHFVELGVIAGGLLHGLLDRKNIRHLRADVKVEQLEAVVQVLGLEESGGGEQLGRAQAELGIFAAALSPFAHALAEQARADADERLDTDLAGVGDNLP